MADPAHNESLSKLRRVDPAQVKQALAQAKTVLPPEAYQFLQKIADTVLRVMDLIQAGTSTTQTLRRLIRVPFLKETDPDPAAPKDPPGSA